MQLYILLKWYPSSPQLEWFHHHMPHIQLPAMEIPVVLYSTSTQLQESSSFSYLEELPTLSRSPWSTSIICCGQRAVRMFGNFAYSSYYRTCTDIVHTSNMWLSHLAFHNSSANCTAHRSSLWSAEKSYRISTGSRATIGILVTTIYAAIEVL